MHDFLDTGDTVVDGDDEVMSFCFDRVDMMDFETIAISESVGIHDLHCFVSQIIVEECIEEEARCHTIDIIIAEDTYRFFVFDCFDDTISPDIHIIEEKGIMSIGRHIGIEKIIACTGDTSIV